MRSEEEIRDLIAKILTYYRTGELERLEQENERLKEENELIKERSKELYTFSATYENDKLKQALQEIREIAGFHTSKDDSEDVQSDMQDILDKINEVIGAE